MGCRREGGGLQRVVGGDMEGGTLVVCNALCVGGRKFAHISQKKMALLQKFKISAHPRETIFFDMVRLEKQWRWFPFQQEEGRGSSKGRGGGGTGLKSSLSPFSSFLRSSTLLLFPPLSESGGGRGLSPPPLLFPLGSASQSRSEPSPLRTTEGRTVEDYSVFFLLRREGIKGGGKLLLSPVRAESAQRTKEDQKKPSVFGGLGVFPKQTKFAK